MRAMRTFSILLVCLVIEVNGFSQTFIKPNYALKSHETLEIKQIIANDKSTALSMSIENRIVGGAFCADRNIYILYPDGSRSKLISSTGIPVCPESYKFKTIGEKLDFVLSFPPLKAGTVCFSLLEDCQENCFSFYGIILDNDLNRKIDDAFYLAENRQPLAALMNFIRIAEETENNSSAAKGLLYINIIKLSVQTGNNVKAAEWYEKLRVSDYPANLYIQYLNSQGIKF